MFKIDDSFVVIWDKPGHCFIVCGHLQGAKVVACELSTRDSHDLKRLTEFFIQRNKVRHLFSDIHKVLELIARTPTKMNQAAKQAVEHAFRMGERGVWLELTDEQYRKLKDEFRPVVSLPAHIKCESRKRTVAFTTSQLSDEVAHERRTRNQSS